MANPWQIVSETPSTGAAAPPAAAAGPWSVVSQTPSAPPAAPEEKSEGLGDWIENIRGMMRPVALPGAYGTASPIDISPEGAGGAKGAGSGLAGLLDFMHWLGMRTSFQQPIDQIFKSQYQRQHPGATEEQANAAYQQLAQQKINDHLKDTSDWLRRGTAPQGPGEMLGYGIELAGEAGAMPELLPEMAPEDILRLTGTRGMKPAEMLLNSKKLAEALAENPAARRYLTIGIKASKAAAEEAVKQGGQAYAHTADPEEARQAAILGGGLGLAAGGLEVGSQAWRDRFGTKTLKIGPVEIPALARQVNEQGFAVPGRAAEAPKIQAAQEAGFQQVIGHTAREATSAVLNKLNDTRSLLRPITDPARLLPPTPVEPPTFTIEGTPPFETQAGPLTQPAEELPGRQAVASYGAPPSPGFGPGFIPGSPWQGAPETVPGYMHPVPEITGPTPEQVVFGGETPRPPAAQPGREDVVRGGGPVTTTSLPEAESWLRRLEDVQSSPEYDEMPEERRAQIEGQRKSLQDQLDMFYAQFKGHPSQTQRFMPIDTAEAARHVNTFGDAAAQIEAAAKPVYQRLDQLSDGQFNKFRQQAKAAKATMKRAGSIDAYDAAQQRYYEANNAIAGLIDSSSPHITAQDYQVARNAWRQSSRLDELDTVFERMMNGVTYKEGQLGMPRYIEKARTKAIQAFLDKGTNQQQLQDMIGREGIINLKNVTNLVSDRATATPANQLMESAMLIARRLGHAGLGAAAGGAAAHFLGFDPRAGAAAGAVTADALRWGWRYAATTPRVGQMIDMAVRNQVSTKIAAPLIARAIAQAAGLYKPDANQPEEEGKP